MRVAFYEARAKWYHIGVELKLSVGTLDAIRSDFSNSTDCFTEMCSTWLKRIDPRPSWEALTEALESPVVGEGHLAQQLRDKCCREMKTHVPEWSHPDDHDPLTSQGKNDSVYSQMMADGYHTINAAGQNRPLTVSHICGLLVILRCPTFLP